MQRIEKSRTQLESISTAYLADTVLSIVHQLYGKEGQYRPNPAAFLPGYKPSEVEDRIDTIAPSPQTIKILLTLIKEHKLHGLIVAHFADLIPIWVEKHD